MSQPPDFEAQWAYFLIHFAAQVPGFHLDSHNEPIYRRLLAYFTADVATQSTLDLDPHKGILLLGPVGCGKTAALRFFERNTRAPYRIVPARDVARRFLTEGFAVLDRYGAQAFAIPSPTASTTSAWSKTPASTATSATCWPKSCSTATTGS